MTEPKPYKSHNQQIKILRERGMNIPKGAAASKVIRILEKENYYNVINGTIPCQVDTYKNENTIFLIQPNRGNIPPRFGHFF